MRKFVEFKFCLINASNFLPIYYGRIRQSKICEKKPALHSKLKLDISKLQQFSLKFCIKLHFPIQVRIQEGAIWSKTPLPFRFSKVEFLNVLLTQLRDSLRMMILQMWRRDKLLKDKLRKDKLLKRQTPERQTPDETNS